MDKLLSFTPEPFPELDREAEEYELDPLAGEWESEEAEEEVRGRRRPRLKRNAPPRSVSKPTLRPRIQGRATGPRVKPLRQLPKLVARPFPVPALRTLPIPFIPPQWGLRPDLEPAPPRDSQRPEEPRRPEQAGSEGIGSPPTAQPSAEPASEHVRWMQDCLNRALGLKLTVDGVMNRETRRTVRLFQERWGLPITGLVGPDTEAALQSTCADTPVPSKNTQPASAQELEITQTEPFPAHSYKRATNMNYQLSLGAEPFSRNMEFGEFATFDTEMPRVWHGETGADSRQRVRWIQESLNKILGLQLKVDGIIGPQTRSAIRRFQQKQGLAADGIVGPSTNAAINTALSSAQIAPQFEPPWTTPALLTPPTENKVQRTVYGWSQYKRRVDELPPDQQAALKSVGDAIIASYKLGGEPVRAVRIYGHADWDTPRKPQREQEMSDERARTVTAWLRNYVGETVAAQIRWDTQGLGAIQLKAQPTTEANRRQNRRVEVFLLSAVTPPTNNCTVPPTKSPAFVLWLKAALNKSVQLSLPSDTTLDILTRSALRTFQQKEGLTSTGTIDRKTFLALRKSYGEEPPCNLPEATWEKVLSGGRAGNKVTALIRGPDTFKAMADAIKTANTAEHYIYLIAWHLTDTLNLDPSDPHSSIRHLFANKSGQGVQIRALIWDDVGNTQNNASNTRINNLRTGASILDNNTLSGGSHHQKILIVKGDQGLITFCGGVDINPDRVMTVSSTSFCPPDAPGGSPLHDVHCKIEGPAALDLLNVFVRRWVAHPNHQQHDRSKGPLFGICESLPAPKGSQFVKIAATFNWVIPRPIPLPAEKKCIQDRSLRDTMISVIRRARRNIYIEDQYLVNMQAARELRNALSAIQRLDIVIGHSDISDLPQRWTRRKAFIDYLLSSPHGSKVQVYFRQSARAGYGAWDYIHSKTWIVDEEVAIIGSANCNRRGWSHDSEVIAAIYDPVFASSLKARLSAAHGGALHLYNAGAGKDNRPCDIVSKSPVDTWDTAIDPSEGERLVEYCLNRPPRPACQGASRRADISYRG